MKKGNMLGAFSSLFLLVQLSAPTGCKTRKCEVDVPAEMQKRLKAGAPTDRFGFYTIANARSLSWNKVHERGFLVCGELPPLIPEKWKSMANGGGFSPGTLLRLSTEEEVGIKMSVPIGAGGKGCATWAVSEMEKTPDLVLLVERSVSFSGKDKLTEVFFK